LLFAISTVTLIIDADVPTDAAGRGDGDGEIDGDGLSPRSIFSTLRNLFSDAASLRNKSLEGDDICEVSPLLNNLDAVAAAAVVVAVLFSIDAEYIPLSLSLSLSTLELLATASPSVLVWAEIEAEAEVEGIHVRLLSMRWLPSLRGSSLPLLLLLLRVLLFVVD
jgi:hypothetical protein